MGLYSDFSTEEKGISTEGVHTKEAKGWIIQKRSGI